MLFLVRSFVQEFLVDDRIDRNGCLTRLTVTDDQLTLATANRNQRQSL
jgi:hypothetical protein